MQVGILLKMPFMYLKIGHISSWGLDSSFFDVPSKSKGGKKRYIWGPLERGGIQM